MSFRAAQETLEGLEWPRVIDRLRESCRTPQARQLLGGHGPGDSEETRSRAIADPEAPFGVQPAGSFASEFSESLAEVRTRLAETSEARSGDPNNGGDATTLADLAAPSRRTR